MVGGLRGGLSRSSSYFTIVSIAPGDANKPDGKLSEAVIRPAKTGLCRVRTQHAVLLRCEGADIALDRDHSVVELRVEARKTYEFFRK